MAKSFWDSSTKPLAIAHRGGGSRYGKDWYRKENTLETFRQTAKLGFEYLELDVVNTKDNKVIVLHVSTDRFEMLLHRKDGLDAKKIQQYTYAQLKKLLGRDIPVLEDIIKDLPKNKLLIDPKTDEVVKPLAEIIKKTKSLDRVLLNSFFISRVERLQQLLGHELNCGVIIGRYPRFMNRRLRALHEGDYFGKGLSAVTVPRRLLNKRIVRLAHQQGIKVLTWAPNSEEEIKRAVKLRADGIISDNAELLISMLKHRKKIRKKA